MLTFVVADLVPGLGHLRRIVGLNDIYFNAAGDLAYLKRADGKVSEWTIATAFGSK